MSKYEMLDYDSLLTRIGITPGQDWFCGNNPTPELTYDEAGMSYDDVAFYNGRGQHHAALCLSEDINVNGLLLNHRDKNGTIWLCTGIEGWWTLPPSEIPDVPKPFWDGSLLTTGRYLSRTITISGCFMPPDPSLVWWNRDALLRVSSIVRGIGLLALCGNQGPGPALVAPFLDPPKMAIVQMADVPLIETTKPNGFTQFSLSFRSVNPTKISLREQVASLPIEDDDLVRERRYRSFATTSAEGDTDTTDYGDLADIQDSPQPRPYSDVLGVDFGALIPGEKYDESGWREDTVDDPEERNLYYQESEASQFTVLHNAGNYFAFPIFVFDEISGASAVNPVTVLNMTTGEEMKILKDVPPGAQLVIDTSLRRVAIVDVAGGSSDWVWDDRSSMSLSSEWISLAPGDNTVVVSKDETVGLPVKPRIHWRDTWIG